MAHDKDPVLACDYFPQRMRLDPRLDSGVLLHLLALPAIVADLLRRLDNGLIATSAQRQVNGCPGKFIVLGIAQAVQAHADTDGNRHLIADIYGLHILQKFETLIAHLSDRALTEDSQILVLFNLFADSVKTGNVLIHLSVNQRDKQRSPHFLHAFQRFVIIVQIYHSHCQGLIIILLQGDFQRRFIKQIHGIQTALVLLLADDITVVSHFPE